MATRFFVKSDKTQGQKQVPLNCFYFEETRTKVCLADDDRAAKRTGPPLSARYSAGLVS
jgi:hypothetical protein